MMHRHHVFFLSSLGNVKLACHIEPAGSIKYLRFSMSLVLHLYARKQAKEIPAWTGRDFSWKIVGP
jgi:hypothetical protein